MLVVVYSRIYRTVLVCLGKTKSLGVLKELSTDHFGIIKRAKHSEGDHWKTGKVPLSGNRRTYSLSLIFVIHSSFSGMHLCCVLILSTM